MILVFQIKNKKDKIVTCLQKTASKELLDKKLPDLEKMYTREMKHEKIQTRFGSRQ